MWLPPDTNERAIVLCEDGLVVTRHADGTVQRWCKRESEGGSATEVVLVECAGFASVEVTKLIYRLSGGLGKVSESCSS